MYWGDKAIVKATEALKVFIHSLPDGSKFNICSFGSNYEYLFKDDIVVDYNDENMQEAHEDMEKYESESMGGTEIFNPLKDIF